MSEASYASFIDWYQQGPLAQHVRQIKSSGGFLDLIEAAQPAGDMSDPAVPDLILYQDLGGGCRVGGDLGSGRFDVTSARGGFFLAAPDFANTVMVDRSHRLRSLSFPTRKWAAFLDGVGGNRPGFDFGGLHRETFESTTIRAALQQLWRLCDDEGAPSRFLAQAAGCHILAELHRLGGEPILIGRGGLAPWAEKRSIEFLRAHLAEDIGLDELAAQARLSPFHFSRMFKHSVGMSPRAYLVRLRIEKACQLLTTTDMSITEIALDVGYSSNQVLARVFLKHKGVSPSDFRRATRTVPHSLIQQQTDTPTV